MKLKSAANFLASLVLLLPFLAPIQSTAQSDAALSGAITDTSGNPIDHAAITAKAATGVVISTASSSDGTYKLSHLDPGDYTVIAKAKGFTAKSATITLAAGDTQTLDFSLTSVSSQQQAPSRPPAATPATELPNAPSSTPAPPNAPTAPSLSDLGFTPQQTQSNPQLQALLQKRTEMLKIHQRLGLITTIPMAAALITGPMAKAKGKNGQAIKEPTTANLDFHAALGGATTGLYFSTAYFAIFAPRVPGTEKHGAIKWHEALAFIHGPGMILTPVLGIMAYKQENAGEKVHGIASAHGAVAYVTAASYGAAILAVSWPIHLKFWEK
ncbi:MAG: carboxypeptidase-like regulatory domain-containing protein [Terracidiphilus sp.]